MGYMYALSWKLLIIGLLSEYFAKLLKRLHLKKIATKCLIFLHQLYFFLIGRSWTFWGDKDQMSPGREKGSIKRGVWERGPKWGGYFCKIPIIKLYTNFYLTNCWSDKLLTTTTAISMPKNLNAGTFKWFQAVLSGQKWLSIFKEQILLLNR